MLAFSMFRALFHSRPAQRRIAPFLLLALAIVGLPALSISAGSVTSWGRQVLPPPQDWSTLMDVAAGQDFNVGLRPGGTVVAWGSNNFRQATVPEGLDEVVAVAAGATHALALRRDGTVFAWGNNSSGQTDVPEDLRRVTAIAAGAVHSVALREDGTVIAWGSNRYRQASPPENLEGVVAIAAGTHHTLALLRGGSVVGWGRSQEGQLAIPDGLEEVVAIAAGRAHSVALRRDGSILSWGDNAFGQISPPGEARQVVRIAAGEDHTLALREDGVVLSWGRNHYGQARENTRPEGGRRIAAGAHHNVILLEDGTLFAWGNNDSGQSLTPGDLAGVVSISATDNHTVALRADGTVFWWGATLSAGVHPNEDQLRNIVAVSAGRAHALALRSDGTVLAWGDNFYRQSSPPPGLADVVAIAAGEFHSLALRSNGTVVAWGNNFQGQVNVPEGLGRVMAIAAGQGHNLALRADGTVVSWGNNFYGQASAPEDLRGVTAIAAGSYHSLALRQDGTIAAWGSNMFGQTNVPPGLSDAVAISASRSHSVAIRENRRLALWGSNFYRQATPPDDLQQVAEVALGAARTLLVQGELQPVRFIQPMPSSIAAAGSDITVVPFLTGSKPMIFQWVRDGRSLPDRNGRALSLEAVDATDSGSYSVIVANPVGNVSSPAFSLEVEDPAVRVEVRPSIAVLGSRAHFLARATGTEPLTFQWMRDGEPVPGEDTPVLTIEEVQEDHTGIYTVRVSNRHGSVESDSIEFYVEPQIHEQPPQFAAARIGERVRLSISATGSRPLQVQWIKDGVPIPGAEEETLVLENVGVEDAGQYVAHLSNPAGQAISAPTQVRIVPHIIFQPEAQAFSGFGGTAVFEVRAIGTPPLIYRWMRNGELIQETREPRLVLDQVQAGEAGEYTVVVANEAGEVESAPARLVLPPAITEHPRSRIVRANERAEFTVAASGSGPFTYQWLRDGQPLAGEDNQTLVISDISGDDSGRYSVTVSNEVGAAQSEGAMLAVSPTILQAPESVAASAGDPVTLEVTAEGTPPLFFQWVRNGETITEATGPSLSLSAVAEDEAGVYSVVVSNSFGIAVSDAAELEVAPRPQFGAPAER